MGLIGRSVNLVQRTRGRTEALVIDPSSI